MIQIKKYANRRLYDTSRSTYINLDDLATLVRDGAEIQVIDASSGEDLTREVLLQVVLETLRGVDFFPTGMLRRLIRATGESPAQKLLRRQIISGMEMMSDQLDRWETLTSPFTPDWAQPSNKDAAPQPPPAATPEPPPPEEPEPEAKDELDELRERLSALEKRLQR